MFFGRISLSFLCGCCHGNSALFSVVWTCRSIQSVSQSVGLYRTVSPGTALHWRCLSESHEAPDDGGGGGGGWLEVPDAAVAAAAAAACCFFCFWVGENGKEWGEERRIDYPIWDMEEDCEMRVWHGAVAPNPQRVNGTERCSATRLGWPLLSLSFFLRLLSRPRLRGERHTKVVAVIDSLKYQPGSHNRPHPFFLSARALPVFPSPLSSLLSRYTSLSVYRPYIPSLSLISPTLVSRW